ncbi:glycosyltransferase family 4 protein [Chitinophagaceae bacterium MMS25-I14]
MKTLQQQKLVFISNIAAPYQVQFCYALNRWFNAEFWFYDLRGNRDDSWNIPLGEKCKVIPGVSFKQKEKYYTRRHLQWLRDYNPDIVMLGGLSIPANYLAYRWAKKNGKKTVLLSEISRTPEGHLRKAGTTWTLLRHLYHDADRIFALNEDAYAQFRDEFGFGEKVKLAHYPTDLEQFFKQPVRTAKETYTLFFANRLINIYNPEGAIRIFHKIWQQYPTTKLQMAVNGTLRAQCGDLVQSLNLQDSVTFLDELRSWNEVVSAFSRADIYFLPAYFSNGNQTIVEAMAAGMGIVISDKVMGNGRLIIHGENGFKVSEADENVFAATIMRYMQHPDLLEQHGAANKQKVQAYGMEGTARLYASLLQEIQTSDVLQ